MWIKRSTIGINFFLYYYLVFGLRVYAYFPPVYDLYVLDSFLYAIFGILYNLFFLCDILTYR